MLFMMNNNRKQLKHPEMGEWYIIVLPYPGILYKILFIKIFTQMENHIPYFY